MKTSPLLTVILSLFYLVCSRPVFGFNPSSTGMVVVKKRPVTIERNGKIIYVSGFGALLENADIVVTGPGGKALIKLSNGDSVLVAQNSRVTVQAGEQSSGLPLVFKMVFGKIRAQIQKSRRRRVRVATANAIIGVKGTDFVVSFQDGKTRVATVEGLVNLASAENDQSIDIPPGKMSEVTPAGEVMTLRDIAGDIMSDVEIAGEKMSDADISGERIQN